MPPPLPTGQRYVPVEPVIKPPAAPLPAPGSFASVPDPAPEAFAPAAPFPSASNTLDPPPIYYPGAGPTVEGFLYQQLGKAMFPGDSAVWTGVQTYQLTDAGTGADSPALRPTAAFWDHITTASPVPGIGLAHTFRAQNTTPALVEIAKICPEITGTTPGLEEGTIAFCAIHQGQMCEIFRGRGQLGMDATATPLGVYGFIGGQLFVRGAFSAGQEGGAIAFGTAPTVTLSDATTNTISDALILDHHTSGTPAPGWGHRIQFDGQSDTTQGRMMGLIETWWAVATDATRQSVMTLRVADAAADREFLRASTNGVAAEVAFLGAAAVPRQTNGTAAQLAAISDANAKAFLTAISNALVNFGLLNAPA